MSTLEKHHHYIVHKPFGMASQFVYTQKRKKPLLGQLHNFAPGTMAIGRLDVDSEGLLLLSTNGKESERIRSKKIEKEYYVQVDGTIDHAAIIALQNGVEIGFKGLRYKTLPCAAKILTTAPNFAERSRKIRDERHGPSSWISITIAEGKFRQVRKMTAAVGFPTLRLVRVRIGSILLGQMEAGAVLEVSAFDC